MKDKTPVHIRELIQNYFKNRHWSQRIDGDSILQIWDQIIPNKIYQNVKPIKIQNNILFVRVKNHIWANEVKIRKGEIIFLLNQNSKEHQIENIVIRIDEQFFNNINLT